MISDNKIISREEISSKLREEDLRQDFILASTG
jgi:hypothetical protein